MKMLQVQKALEQGILPPPLQDPELQTKLLTEYGIVDLKGSLNVDRKQIARELDRWKAAHSPDEITPPDPTTQELPLHLFFKKGFLKTEEFEDLREANKPLADAMVAHVQQLEQAIAQKAAQAAAAQNPPPPQKDDTRKPVEKGDRSALDAAVQSGVLTPAGTATETRRAGRRGERRRVATRGRGGCRERRAHRPGRRSMTSPAPGS
jgi:hypothetical protein